MTSYWLHLQNSSFIVFRFETSKDRKAVTNINSILKSKYITLLTKVYIVQAMVFPVVTHRCENWTIKKAECCEELMLSNCGVGEDSWASLGQQLIRPANPKGNQPWIFIGRTDAEVEAPVLWPPDMKSSLIGKDPDVAKDQGQEEGMTEDEVFEWHHRLKRHEFEQTPRDSEGQRSQTCCSPWGGRESDMTE